MALQYPTKPYAFAFCKSLCHMFFGLGAFENVMGLAMLIKTLVLPSKPKVY